MRLFRVLAESVVLFLVFYIVMLVFLLIQGLIAPDVHSEPLACLYGIMCVGSLAVPISWALIRLNEPVPPPLRLKTAIWRFHIWDLWYSPRARVMTHRIKSKKKKKFKNDQPGRYFDASLVYTVRGSGIQAVKPIPLAEGTYSVHYAFSGDCRVHIDLVHVRDRYRAEMLHGVAGNGSSVFAVPEDAYFLVEVKPYGGVLKSWKLVIKPAKS